MLKPHIWVRDGSWCGEIAMTGDAAWRAWFDSYEQFVSQGRQRSESAAWAAYVSEVNGIASTVSNGLVVQRLEAAGR